MIGNADWIEVVGVKLKMILLCRFRRTRSCSLQDQAEPFFDYYYSPLANAVAILLLLHPY